jgi:predicted phage-related endonuclease
MVPGWQTSEHEYSGRDEWLNLRKMDVTASDAGALWPDIHKYKTRRKLFLEKSFGENDEQTMVMRRGKIMEPAVAEAIVVDCGWKPERCTTYLRGRAADPLVRMGASRDYKLNVLADELLRHPKMQATARAAGWAEFAGRSMHLTIECKSLDPQVWENEWRQGPPVYTVVQSAQQTLLANADGGIIAALLENRSKDLILYAVGRDRAFELQLITQVRDFWRSYEAGEEPAISGGDNDHMTDYYPTSDDALEVDLADDAAYWTKLVLEREELKLGMKTLDKRVDEIEAHIKDRMRDAARAKLPGWNITWRTDSRGTRTFKVSRELTQLTPRPKRTRR